MAAEIILKRHSGFESVDVQLSDETMYNEISELLWFNGVSLHRRIE